MPTQANPQGTAFGGAIVGWIDMTAAMAAQRHCGCEVVTAGIDSLVFRQPIRIGDHVVLKAAVNYVSRSSMEVGVQVIREDPYSGRQVLATTAHLMLVALDEKQEARPRPAAAAADAGGETTLRKRPAAGPGPQGAAQSHRTGKPDMTAGRTIAAILILCLGLAASGQAFAKHYSVSIPPEGDAKYKEANFVMWVPEDAGPLRGVILHQHGCGEPAETAGATATFDLQWQALAKKWDCALMGSNYRMAAACNDWCFPENGSEGAFLKALEHFAKDAGREEITRAPWVLWGHSGGAEWVYRMFTRHPERVLVLVLRSGPVFTETLFTGSPETPVLYNIGLREKGDKQLFGRIWDKADRLVQARREQGALDTWAPDPQASHDCRFGRLFVIPYVDACLAQRLGAPGTALMAPMDLSQSWFGNVETFEICPAGKYSGDPSKAAWLPNERIASLWKEFVTTGWVTDKTPPPAPAELQASPGDANQIVLRWQAQADFESGLKTFRIYRDGRQLADYNASAGGLFQKPNYHDTLDKPLSETTYCDPNAPRSGRCTYEVTAVNWSDLESPRSAPAVVRIETAQQKP